MDDLSLDLVRMCRRNRDGAFGTQTNRRRGLTAMARELRELGFKLNSASSLKPRHVAALVSRWQTDGLGERTIRNRMSWLRWWAAKVNKAPVVRRRNAEYDISNGRTTRNRAFALDARKLAAITCPHVRMSVTLQTVFGLRREEAMKIRPAIAIRDNVLVLKPSWTKGGRGRIIPVTTQEQRNALVDALNLAGQGSLIPAERPYVTHMKTYEYQTAKAGLYNLHGLRHAYAQRRYLALTGMPCPLQGGVGRTMMSAAQRELDRQARLRISAELGHGRISVTDVYLGRAAG